MKLIRQYVLAEGLYEYGVDEGRLERWKANNDNGKYDYGIAREEATYLFNYGDSNFKVVTVDYRDDWLRNEANSRPSGLPDAGVVLRVRVYEERDRKIDDWKERRVHFSGYGWNFYKYLRDDLIQAFEGVIEVAQPSVEAPSDDGDRCSVRI